MFISPSKLKYLNTLNDNTITPVLNGSSLIGNLQIRELGCLYAQSRHYQQLGNSVKIVKEPDTSITIEFSLLDTSNIPIIIKTKNGQTLYYPSNNEISIAGYDEFQIALRSSGPCRFNLKSGEISYIDFSNLPELTEFSCNGGVINTDTISFLNCPDLSVIDFSGAAAGNKINKIFTTAGLYTNITNQTINI